MLELHCFYICSMLLNTMDATGSPEYLCGEIVRMTGGFTEFSLTNTAHRESCCTIRANKMDICSRICFKRCIIGMCPSRDACICDDGRHNCGIPTVDCFTMSMFGQECVCNANRTFGENCYKRCNCLMGDCDLITGRCACYPGYTGKNCSKSCLDGKYGAGCRKTCICQNRSECDKTNGQCSCKPGFEGQYCERICHLGTWGENCSKICECHNCRATDGFCKCQENWKGATCSDYCPTQFYDVLKNECIEQSTNIGSNITQRFYFNQATIIFIGIITATSTILVIIIVAITIALISLRYTKRHVKISSHHRNVIPPTQNARFNHESDVEEHHYETISDGSITPVYHKLCRSGELPKKFRDPTYFDGYERPRLKEATSLPNVSSEYVFLNRDSLGPP